MIIRTTSEDPAEHYAGVNASGHIVLDLGAGDFGRVGALDYPTTVEHWHNQGAESIIAVDANQNDLDKLVPFISASACMYVKQPEHIENFYVTYQPTFVKVDIEGAEAHLCFVHDSLFTIPEVYVVETHSVRLFNACWRKLVNNNYNIKNIIYLDHTPEGCKVIVATKEA